MTSASVRVEHKVPFVCRACGTSKVLRIVGRGRFTESTGPWGLLADEAKDAARAGAAVHAEEDAFAAVRLARCPRCRRGGEAFRLLGWLSYWREAGLATCVALVGVSVVALLARIAGLDIEHGRAGDLMSVVGAAAMFATPLATAIGLHLRRVREIDTAARA